jgi:hypothetical protein
MICFIDHLLFSKSLFFLKVAFGDLFFCVVLFGRLFRLRFQVLISAVLWAFQSPSGRIIGCLRRFFFYPPPAGWWHLVQPYSLRGNPFTHKKSIFFLFCHGFQLRGIRAKKPFRFAPIFFALILPTFSKTPPNQKKKSYYT